MSAALQIRKKLPVWRVQPAHEETERPPRSLDDPEFREELENPTHPLRDESFFRSIFNVWIGAIVTMVVVSLPIVFVVWRYYDFFAALNKAMSNAGVP
jgi:hypothetical protein